jgi:hypothetical protein
MDKALNPVEVYAPERSNKFELNEKIHFDTMDLLYNHITELVVEGSKLLRILAQLMLQTATSKEKTDWQTFPKNIKAIRIQEHTTIESKTSPGFPEMGDRP